MGFWDFFKKNKPAAPAAVTPETTPVVPASTLPPASGPAPNAMRDGKKHGRWSERAEKPTTRWDDKKREYVPIDYDTIECEYVDGVQHGPFIIRWGDGGKQREGTYVDGKLDGHLQIWSREGVKRGDAHYRAGKLNGVATGFHENGEFSYTSSYVDDKRSGPWRQQHENGQASEVGAHVDGARDGMWTVTTKDGVVTESGAYVLGKRDGEWTISSPTGIALEHGAYAQGERVGTWTYRRADGSLRAEGQYLAGKMTGAWQIYTPAGEPREPREVVDEALERWDRLATCVDLLVDYGKSGGDAAWVARARTVFVTLNQPWQVTTSSDKYGQQSVSAPLGSTWQLRVAVGVPMPIVCRDECWSEIVRLLDTWPPGQLALAVAAARGAGEYPSVAPREWLTAILEGDAEDPRTQLVSRFEPGRSFTVEKMRRFRQRVPHLKELTLRECAFPEGLTPLFEGGFPKLERLVIVRSETPSGAIAALVAQLAQATWLNKLVQLAIVESGNGVGDAGLGALLGNPSLASLRFLTLDIGVLGSDSGKAIAGLGQLDRLDLREMPIEAAGLKGIAKLPALDELHLKECVVGDVSMQQFQAMKGPPKLKILTLRGSLGVERYASEDERSGKKVLRKLARMPVLASLETLDLSSNDLDGEAAAELAKSKFLGNLKKLDLTGNELDDEELAALRQATPNAKIETDTRRGNVVIVDLGAK